jgi:rubrerythrin
MNDLLEIAIKMEENAEAIYNTAEKKIKPQALKRLLKWMADEEVSHGKWFADQKNNTPLEMDEARLKSMAPQALQNMMGEKTLNLEDINFNKITKTSTLLETFIDFENETILFYEMLEMFIQEKSVLKGLKQIILEEKTHIETLNSMMESLPEK